jgi:hypothetical protein
LPLQAVCQQPGEKKKLEIKPGIAGFDKSGEKSKESRTHFKPPYLVEPPYMEEILRAPNNLSLKPGNAGKGSRESDESI